MAILYNQQESGVPYQRAYRVVIENQYNKTPRCEFYEEMISDYGKGVMTQKVGSLKIAFDPAKTYDLLDPDSGSVIGQFTQGQLYAMLYSIYIKEANERDAVALAQSVITQPPVDPPIEPPIEPPTE